MIDQSYRNSQFEIFFVGTVFGVEVKLLKNVESGSNFSQAFIFDMYSNTLISRREYVRIVRHWIFYPNKMIGKDQREDLIRMSNFTFFEQQFKLKWKVKILAIDVLFLCKQKTVDEVCNELLKQC